jgi:hypothetical protein
MRVDTRGSREDLELGERIARLEDLEALRTLWSHYAYLADTENTGELISGLHAAQATWESVGPGDFGRYRGQAEIAKFFDDLYAVSPFRHHAMTNDYIDLADDRRTAIGRWKLTDLCTMGMAAPDAAAVLLLGNYEVEFVKEADGWKIDAVHLTSSAWSDWTRGWVDQPDRNVAR